MHVYQLHNQSVNVHWDVSTMHIMTAPPVPAISVRLCYRRMRRAEHSGALTRKASVVLNGYAIVR